MINWIQLYIENLVLNSRRFVQSKNIHERTTSKPNDIFLVWNIHTKTYLFYNIREYNVFFLIFSKWSIQGFYNVWMIWVKRSWFVMMHLFLVGKWLKVCKIHFTMEFSSNIYSFSPWILNGIWIFHWRYSLWLNLKRWPVRLRNTSNN